MTYHTMGAVIPVGKHTHARFMSNLDSAILELTRANGMLPSGSSLRIQISKSLSGPIKRLRNKMNKKDYSKASNLEKMLKQFKGLAISEVPGVKGVYTRATDKIKSEAEKIVREAKQTAKAAVKEELLISKEETIAEIPWGMIVGGSAAVILLIAMMKK